MDNSANAAVDVAAGSSNFVHDSEDTVDIDADVQEVVEDLVRAVAEANSEDGAIADGAVVDDIVEIDPVVDERVDRGVNAIPSMPTVQNRLTLILYQRRLDQEKELMDKFLETFKKRKPLALKMTAVRRGCAKYWTTTRDW